MGFGAFEHLLKLFTINLMVVNIIINFSDKEAILILGAADFAFNFGT